MGYEAEPKPTRTTQVLRVGLLIVLLSLGYLNPLLCWPLVLIWAILCIFGIVITLAVGFLLHSLGAAHLDWMSDGTEMMLFFVLSTGISIIASEYFRCLNTSSNPPSSGDVSDCETVEQKD